MTLAAFGFHFYDVLFVINAIVMTIALYEATSIVVEGGVRQLLLVSAISLFAVVVFNLFFSLFQQFTAFCISSLLVLVLIKYFLVGSHDSGWFGAFCIEFLSFLFLFVIELILVALQLVFFSNVFLSP